VVTVLSHNMSIKSKVPNPKARHFQDRPKYHVGHQAHHEVSQTRYTTKTGKCPEMAHRLLIIEVLNNAVKRHGYKVSLSCNVNVVRRPSEKMIS